MHSLPSSTVGAYACMTLSDGLTHRIGSILRVAAKDRGREDAFVQKTHCGIFTTWCAGECRYTNDPLTCIECLSVGT